MQRLFYVLLVTLFLASCKTPTSSKLDAKTTNALKGTYQVTDVSFEGGSMFKVKVFEIADSKCFIGSKWNFIANNNKGSIALDAAGCPSYESKTTWFINKDGNFVLKILDENKARKVTEGYVLGLRNINENGFQLVERVNVAGKMSDLVFQFSKN